MPDVLDACPVAHGSIRRHLAVAIGLSVALVVGVGGWATSTDISAAVIAPGQLLVETDVKKVQYPTGGVVGELLAREGQRVAVSREGGETVIEAGEAPEGPSHLIPVTMIDNPDESSRIVREEQFGPVLQLIRFTNVVARANATEYGLAATV